MRQRAEHEVEAERRPVERLDRDELRQRVGRELRKHLAHLLPRLAVGGEQRDLDLRMTQQQAHAFRSGIAGGAEHADLRQSGQRPMALHQQVLRRAGGHRMQPRRICRRKRRGSVGRTVTIRRDRRRGRKRLRRRRRRRCAFVIMAAPIAARSVLVNVARRVASVATGRQHVSGTARRIPPAIRAAARGRTQCAPLPYIAGGWGRLFLENNPMQSRNSLGALRPCGEYLPGRIEPFPVGPGLTGTG